MALAGQCQLQWSIAELSRVWSAGAIGRQWASGSFRKTAATYVIPAAFQAAAILNDFGVGGGVLLMDWALIS